jgi:hypothetical protein
VTHTRFDLRASLGVADAEIVGAAYQEGSAYVLEDNLGLYRIDEQGNAERIYQLLPGLTDMAAVGDGRFAITMVNDGFMLDVEKQTFEQHFCYEPGWIGDRFAPTPTMQLTKSVAVDSRAGVIYAQPQTMDETNPENVLLAQVGVWDLATGLELEWHDLENVGYLAGGMVVESDRVLLLGRGDRIDRYRLDTGAMEPAYDLSSNGIDDVRGMALRDDGKLLVVDGRDDELVLVSN